MNSMLHRICSHCHKEFKCTGKLYPNCQMLHSICPKCDIIAHFNSHPKEDLVQFLQSHLRICYDYDFKDDEVNTLLTTLIL